MNDYSNLIERSFGRSNPALPQTVGNIAEDPDRAARALDLAKATGVPGTAIYGDLDEFERQHKATLASDIVANNPHLSDFVQSNPMVPKIANDDYGALDSVSSKVSAMDLPLRILRVPEKLGEMLFPGDPLHRFKEGGPLGSWIINEDTKNHPFLAATAAGLGTPIELLFRGFGGVQNIAADVAANIGEATGQPGIGRDVGAMIQSAGLTGRVSPMGPMQEVYERARTYVENGREPLPTVLPEYDAYRAQRNAADVDALIEATQDAQQSLVRERNPELFKQFIAQHTDAEIGISGDIVAALYGDKLPLPDDGLLGWVPGIADKLNLARATGDDVSIPLSDWLTHVDPKIMQALHDDIRVRPGAITVRESALAAESLPSAPIPEDVPTIRAAGALEPQFSIGDRKLKLERLELPNAGYGRPEFADFHDFNLLDEKGNSVGTINLSAQKDGKQLYVEMINGINGLGPRDFGPALMRDLLRQLKAEFPNAETITGHRVSGAREKVGTYMAPSASPVVKLDNPNLEHFGQILEGGQWEVYSPNIQAYIKPYAERTLEDRRIIDMVNEELNRIAPQKLQVQPAERITAKGVRGQAQPIEPTGAYIPYRETYPVLLYALEGENPLGTARHEAIHHLRTYNFFDKTEWATLERSAIDQGWLEQFNIKERYPRLDHASRVEESIADAYKAWEAGRFEAMPEVQSLFERMKAFFDRIRERLTEMLGREPTWEDIFQRVSTGEVGAREGRKPLLEGAFDEALSAPEEPSRIFERANALGMTIEQYKAYDKLIAKRHAEDIETATKRVEAQQRREQTKAWKEERSVLRQKVADEINLRPDVAADNYFADGKLFGESVERIKIGTDFLTPEQQAALPRDYYNKSGVHPDELAPLFGYPDGATLVTNLSSLSSVRRASGMRAIDFKRRIIDIETDRQMQLKHGVLEDNIVDAVKEQVASQTQLDILHEETLFYGTKVGEAPLAKEAIIGAIQDEFEKSPLSSVSSDRYLATAGRAGRATEMALLHNDPATAFKEKQRQYYATILAKEAVQLEQQIAKFDKLKVQLSKREVKQVEPEYLDYIHGLLLDASVLVKRSLEEVTDSKASYGYDSLASFVASKAGEGWDLAVSDALQAGVVKPLNDMTVAEFRDFNDAITSLNHVGREVRKIEVAGEKRDWVEFRAEVINTISQLPERPRESQGRWLYKIDASLTRMEEIAKDLDLRQELGPLHQAVIEPMMRSKAKEFDLMTDLSKHFQETKGDFGGKWRRSLKETIDQDILHDPYTGAAYDMTKENLIQIMLNWGNRSNINKFVQGAGMARFGRRLSKEEAAAYEDQIKALVDKHATALDWQFVQRMWEPFKGWQDQMNTVSRNVSGVTPKWIKIDHVETPHGTFEGGYWPVKYDRLGSNIAVAEERKPTSEGVFGQDYFRAATAKGYLKERTGYVDFVDISTSLEQAAGTMQQTIHDIAFRDSLIQAGKVFYDKGIRAAIRKHYGSEYEAQLIPWLRRIAHSFTTDDTSIAGYNDLLRRTRINLVGHALPLNLKVILSPDVGVPNPKAWTSYLANRSENVALAMEKSDEIRHLVYNMDRDFRESLDRITLNPNVSDLQKKAVKWGFTPIAKVSQEFRISTFVDQYRKAIGRGKTEQEAALIADSFVRERHGAASVVDLPAVMQSSEGMKMLTMFYGYFNTMYNWQRQLPGNIRRGEAKEFAVNGLGSVIVGTAFGAALFNTRKEDDSWFKIMGKALLMQPLSTIPVLNTAASYYMEGFAPRTPIAALLSAAGAIVNDTKKAWKGLPIEKPITHAANVIGLSTGMPLAQIGRTAQFGMDVATRKQRPKNITEYARGIISGESKLKR